MLKQLRHRLNRFIVALLSRGGDPDPLPRWSTLGKLGENPYVRSSYFWLVFVPIAAKALEGVGTKHAIHLLGSTFSLQLSLPFSWIAFFFAALLGSIGTLIYSSFCPRIIRQYDAYPEFEETGQGWPQLRQMLFEAMADQFQTEAGIDAAIARLLLDHNADNSATAQRQILSRSAEAAFSGHPTPGWVTPNPQIIDELMRFKISSRKYDVSFWAIRDFAEQSQTMARLACTAAYSGFAFLMGWIFLQNIIAVVRLAMT